MQEIAKANERKKSKERCTEIFSVPRIGSQQNEETRNEAKMMAKANRKSEQHFPTIGKYTANGNWNYRN